MNVHVGRVEANEVDWPQSLKCFSDDLCCIIHIIHNLHYPQSNIIHLYSPKHYFFLQIFRWLFTVVLMLNPIPNICKLDETFFMKVLHYDIFLSILGA